MDPRDLKIGDVVQISPDVKDCFFNACFMIVSSPKPWGAEGYICMPTGRNEKPGLAYFRASWEIMEFIGHAEWIAQ